MVLNIKDLAVNSPGREGNGVIIGVTPPPLFTLTGGGVLLSTVRSAIIMGMLSVPSSEMNSPLITASKRRPLMGRRFKLKTSSSSSSISSSRMGTEMVWMKLVVPAGMKRVPLVLT